MVLPQTAVPAFLGLNIMQDSNTILDLRDNKLHMWIASDRDDLEIRVKPGREKSVSKLQMAKAPSGHLLLKCTDYPQDQSAWTATFFYNQETAQDNAGGAPGHRPVQLSTPAKGGEQQGTGYFRLSSCLLRQKPAASVGR